MGPVRRERLFGRPGDGYRTATEVAAETRPAARTVACIDFHGVILNRAVAVLVWDFIVSLVFVY